MESDSTFSERLGQADLNELEALWLAALRRFLQEIQAADHYAEAEAQVRQHPAWTALQADWITLPTRAREERYQRLLEAVEQAGYATRPYCISCGACCRRASPSLFVDDRELLTRGIVKRSQVYTLRRGERVRLPEPLGTMQLSDEMIKIRESDQGHCLFFDAEAGRCTIYDDRPLQCRAQACWDLSDLKEALTQREPLTRPHVLSSDEPVAEAVIAHEAHCSVFALAEDFEDVVRGKETAMSSILDALAYDTQLRPFLAEKLPLPEEDLEFLFGRPLTRVVRQFGVEVVREPDGTHRLQPVERQEPDADA
jgi:Fe-S-cluster containining protein